MSQEEATAPFNGEYELSVEESAILEGILKGKLSKEFNQDRISRREKYSPVVLSFGQQRLWVIDQLTPGNPFYNVSMPARITGKLDVPLFGRCINEVIRRRESLRTIFTTENEEPVQVILPKLELTVQTIDLRDLSGEEQEKEIKRLAFEDATKPFDLKTGPLLRTTLLYLRADEYVLLFTMHHIISDTWSMDLFIKEISEVYIAFSSGKSSPLSEPPLQYADFALWQRQHLQGEILDKQLAYWKEQLGHNLPILELPTDRPRPAVQSFKGGSLNYTLAESLGEKLVNLISQEESSLFMIMLTVFNILLYRYSGQDDILVGSPIANRNRVELEEIMGYLSNTLVFRTNLSGNPSFRQLLERVREITSGAYDNQDIPFEKLVEVFQPERYMSHTPLFQVMLVIPSLPKWAETPMPLPIDITPIDVHNDTSKFDLCLYVNQAGHHLGGQIQYNSDIFDHSTIMRLSNHFEILLEGVVRDPDQPINYLQIFPEQEKRLLMDLNNTHNEYNSRCLHHAFEDQVEKTPDRIALIGMINPKFEIRNSKQNQITKKQNSKPESGTWKPAPLSAPISITYRELNEKSDRLAGLLIEKGVGIDTIVGIMVERSIEMITGLLGILKAGGAYLPIDPDYPEERINYMLADSKVQVMLIDNASRHFNCQLLMVNCQFSMNEKIQPAVRSSQLAYVIYTSGTTGKPKGVLLEHTNVVHLMVNGKLQFDFSNRDVWTMFHSYCFDFSVWEMYGALLYGGKLVIIPRMVAIDTGKFLEVLKNEGVTVLNQTPSAFYSLIHQELDSSSGVLKDGKLNLRYVIFGGETLNPARLQEWKATYPKTRLINMYGITETTVHVTFKEVTDKDMAGNISNIGKPIPTSKAYVLNSYLTLQPMGIPGECCVGGNGLARGYLNNPELTGEKFIESPYISGETLYRSGDLVKMTNSGDLQYLGRIDRQVKIRGFRIELGEIESRLRNHPFLEDAVVINREDLPGTGDKKLCAYIIPDHDYLALYREKSGIDLAGEQVSDWQEVFNGTYKKAPSRQDPLFNIVGWNSSYTGAPLPAEEMQQWVDYTVDRILSLRPGKILEIGCGTGLLLFRIIPHCDFYMGTDISKNGLNYIHEHLNQVNQGATVELVCKPADDFREIEADTFELVILNSVVQYFPSIDYLRKVLKNALEVVKPGGNIFIGDVRSLPLLEMFHASIGFHRSGPDTTRNELRKKVLNQRFREKELVIDPAFFTAVKEHFPRIKHVKILLKRGRYHNELTRFRYDVILHIGDKDENDPGIAPCSLDWQQDGLSISEVRRWLKEKESGYLEIANIPNARLVKDLHVLQWLNSSDERINLGQFLEVPAKNEEMGIDPEDFWRLGEEFPYYIDVVVTSSGVNRNNKEGHGCRYDVLFRHRDLAGDASYRARTGKVKSQPWDAFANKPLLAKASVELALELRNFLKEKLPGYMVPSYFIPLETLPLTVNGKLDRQALPGPVQVQAEVEKEIVKPHTQVQTFLADIWVQLLGLESVGINENFFELGGDSIIAIQMVSRSNKQGFQLSIQDLFINQTIEELARVASQNALVKEKDDVAVEGLSLKIDWDLIYKHLPPGTEIEFEDVYPASPLQCHMLNVLRNQTDIEPPLFLFQRLNPPIATALDISILEQAMQKAMDIYPFLRTVLIWKDLEEPVQVVCKKAECNLTYKDLSHLSQTEQNQWLKKKMKEEWDRGFQRNSPILFRVVIVKLNEDLFQYFYTGDYLRVEGWSIGNFFGDLFGYYNALISGQERKREIKDYYKMYLANLKNQDLTQAEKYWRLIFKGFKSPKSLIKLFPGNNPVCRSGLAKQHFHIPEETTAKLDILLRKERFVFSTIMQAIWILLLGCYSNEEDVVYGFLTTGRSNASFDIDEMCGYAINILPVRMKINRQQLLKDFLKQIWDKDIDWTRFEYIQIEKIYEWLGISMMENPLFETLVVIQNIIRKGMTPNQQSSNSNQFELFHAKMEYPLRVDINPEERILLVMNYYRRYFADSVIKGLLENFHVLIEAVVANPDQTLGELMKVVDTDRYKLYESSELIQYFMK
jgi:amino acid adenylation domain-containing protein